MKVNNLEEKNRMLNTLELMEENYEIYDDFKVFEKICQKILYHL